jgi:hypothetical protein
LAASRSTCNERSHYRIAASGARNGVGIAQPPSQFLPSALRPLLKEREVLSRRWLLKIEEALAQEAMEPLSQSIHWKPRSVTTK